MSIVEICSVCGSPATVEFKEICNGVPRITYYCDSHKVMATMGVNNLNNVVNNLFAGSSSSRNNRQCKCGMTERLINQDHNLGCAECYNIFSDIIEKYMTSNALNAHIGTIPLMQTKTINKDVEVYQNLKNDKISILKKNLTQAIAEEKYLEADSLVKQIALLEQ